MQKAKDPKVSVKTLGFLVLSFVRLAQIIQQLRGVPTPGQLRPDLDPQQLARAVHRFQKRLANSSSITVESRPLKLEDSEPAMETAEEQKTGPWQPDETEV
jgi:hypothetical protein